MWKCLPFASEDDPVMATASRRKGDEAIVPKIYVAEAGEKAAAFQTMIRWQSTGVSFWFTYLYDCLGQAFLSYYDRAVEKVEKLEYYY